MRRIPYFRQRTDWTCGPASLRMVLAAFGERVLEERLAREARTSRRTGTRNAELVRVLRRRGLDALLTCRLTRASLTALVREGATLVVHYRVPGDDIAHFAVVTGADARGITLHDPWLGPSARLSWRAFLPRWYGLHNAPPGHGRAVVVRGRTP